MKIMRVSLAEGKALVRGIYKELCFLKRRFSGEKYKIQISFKL